MGHFDIQATPHRYLPISSLQLIHSHTQHTISENEKPTRTTKATTILRTRRVPPWRPQHRPPSPRIQPHDRLQTQPLHAPHPRPIPLPTLLHHSPRHAHRLHHERRPLHPLLPRIPAHALRPRRPPRLGRQDFRIPHPHANPGPAGTLPRARHREERRGRRDGDVEWEYAAASRIRASGDYGSRCGGCG